MVPPLCANGCGFYGSASAMDKNLCSKCYKDYLKQIVTKSDDDGLNGETKNLNDEVFNVLESSTSDVGAAMGTVAPADSASTNKKNKRCKSCNRMVGIMGFECRCGNVFCGRHRYPEQHACTVDLKEIGRKALFKQNPLCIGDKLKHRI
ncbi:hypothetical protein VNO77_33396 [Canavalia gladiata]|uniref:Uncharacterized protein n=1 Tax=Canavalia gladiata TaxID=3824 RepID=A0AAN9Q0L3_CANGL